MDLIDHIEDAFGELGMIKGSKKNHRIIIRGRLMTRMKNIILGLISEVNPR